MRTYFYISIALFSVFGMVSHSYAEGNSRPFCYDVNVQIDRDNQANVQQNCDNNYSRTAQAGKNNSATTQQGGEYNSNTVRQYEYDATPRIPRR